jgi:fructan beta-fructosidase
MKGDTSDMKQSTMRSTRSVSALTLASLSLAAALAGSMPAAAAELGDEQHRPAIH